MRCTFFRFSLPRSTSSSTDFINTYLRNRQHERQETLTLQKAIYKETLQKEFRAENTTESIDTDESTSSMPGHTPRTATTRERFYHNLSRDLQQKGQLQDDFEVLSTHFEERGGARIKRTLFL